MQPELRRLQQRVQIARRELRLDDEEYRALLAAVTGQRSSKGLDGRQLEAVLARLTALGFKPKAKKAKAGRPLSPPSSEPVLAAEVRRLRAIWITMAKQGFLRDGSEPALAAYVQRMTAKRNGGLGVARVDWLKSEQAGQVLDELKAWHRRLMMTAITQRGDELPLNLKGTAPAGYDKVALVYDNPGWRSACPLPVTTTHSAP